MKTSPFTPRHRRVALLLETSGEYGRGLLRGIIRYSSLHGPWSLDVAPGHLQQELPHGGTWHGDGIIARVRSPKILQAIQASGIPCVASDLSEPSLATRRAYYGQIRTNSRAIALMAAAHLIDRGLHHFAFCGFCKCEWSACREKTFVDFLHAKGLTCASYRLKPAHWLRRSHWIDSWEYEQEGTIQWLRSLPKPIGVMACNDICGLGLLEACTTARLHVPDQVAIVGVDNDELLCELANPPLSSVALDLDEVGYQAAQLLDDMMVGRPIDRYVVSVEPTHVVARLSTDIIAQKDPAMATALRAIRNESQRDIGVPDVVARAGISRRSLERRFARALGRSILAEITRVRVDRAKRVLVETNLPCGQVGAMAGFRSIKSFNRTFKRIMGIPPHLFRRQYSSTETATRRAT